MVDVHIPRIDNSFLCAIYSKHFEELCASYIALTNCLPFTEGLKFALRHTGTRKYALVVTRARTLARK